jgi:hypothetical protein
MKIHPHRLQRDLLAIAGWIQPGGRWLFFWTYILTIWLGAVMIRQLQWVEHLGIVSNGSLAERNLLHPKPLLRHAPGMALQLLQS